MAYSTSSNAISGKTTPQMLALTGERSPLSNYSRDGILLIDRDPDLFSVILSLLRTNMLPSNATKFDVQDLSREARFYGLDQVLMASRLNLPLRSRLKDRLRHWEITTVQRSDALCCIYASPRRPWVPCTVVEVVRISEISFSGNHYQYQK